MSRRVLIGEVYGGLRVEHEGWRIVKVSPSRLTVTVKSCSGLDVGARFNGRRYQFRWDGSGYVRSGRYLAHYEQEGSDEDTARSGA